MIVRLRFFLLVLCSIIALPSLRAQNYQALHGSSYAGSLGVANNPASIVHVPFAWDITPLAVQLKHSTNAFVVNGASLLSPGGAEVLGIPGNRKRVLLANQDIRLFNARIRLSPQSAIAFGASIRNYLSANTSVVNWQEFFADLRNFIDINTNNFPLSATARAGAWAELHGSYARTLINKDAMLLNAGITLKVNKGLGGGYLTADELAVVPGTVNGDPGYYVTGGNLAYGYSSNLDDLDGARGFSAIRKQLLKRTFASVSASLGAELIIPADIEGDEGNNYAYDLKLGVSLLDLGYNTYQYSNNSRLAILNKANISDSLVQSTFEGLSGVDDLPDSLQVVAGSTSTIGGYFQLYQPMRIVINADKHVSGHFFINGELTIPLTAALEIGEKKKLFFREMNLLAITPRYETKTIGFYLPMLYNTNKQFWIGGAFKAGPLLLGVHNLGNLFSKNKLQNGGGYLALTFRPGKKQQQTDKQQNLQSKKLSRRERKNLDCPVL
ncbi:MAG: hypothetical protein SGI83_14635 [Bacteroidota bacterium]|nr:hypothetical protein [Bacteroidota bacterium]